MFQAEPLFCVAQPEMFVSEKSMDTLKSFLTINHYLYITFIVHPSYINNHKGITIISLIVKKIHFKLNIYIYIYTYSVKYIHVLFTKCLRK